MTEISAPQWHMSGPSLFSPGLAFGNVRNSMGMGEGSLTLGPLDEIRAAFGPAKTADDMNKWYDSQPVDHYLLPQAYDGENKHVLGVIIAGLSRNRKNSPFQRIAPLQLANGLRGVTVERHIYNDTTWDAEPEEGVARMVSKSWRRWGTSTFRAGKAFRMENGFAMTEKGKQDYLNTITQIICGLRDRLDLSCLYSIMNPPTTSDMQLANARSRGFAHHRDNVLAMLEAETVNFGCLQKNDGNNTDVFFSQIDEQFRRNGSTSTRTRLILVPKGTARLVEVHPSPYASFQEMGPLGAQIKHSGNMWSSAANKYGFVTVEVEEYPLEENADPSCPLVKEVVVGEHHFVNRSRTHQDHHRREGDGKFDLGSLDLVIMNYASNMTNIVRYRDMLRATGIWDAHGNMTAHWGVNGYFGGFQNLGQWAATYGYSNGRTNSNAKSFNATAHAAMRRDPLKVSEDGIAAVGKVIRDSFTHDATSTNSAFVTTSRNMLIQDMRNTPSRFDDGIVRVFEYALTAATLFNDEHFRRARSPFANADDANRFHGGGINMFGAGITFAGDLITLTPEYIFANRLHPVFSFGGAELSAKINRRFPEIGGGRATDMNACANIFWESVQHSLRDSPNLQIAKEIARIQGHGNVSEITVGKSRSGYSTLVTDWLCHPDSMVKTEFLDPYRENIRIKNEDDYHAFFKQANLVTADEVNRAVQIGDVIGSAFLSLQGYFATLNEQDVIAGWTQFWSVMANPALWTMYPIVALTIVNISASEVQKSIDDGRLLNTSVFSNCSVFASELLSKAAQKERREPLEEESHRVLVKDISDVTLDEFLLAVEDRLCPEIGVAIFRPDMCFMMGSAISCREGCAATLLADPNFMLESNASQKTLFGHVTAYSAVAVLQPEEIVLVPNVVNRGSLGGVSTTFWNPTRPDHQNIYTDGQDIYNNIESMFAVPLNPNETMQNSKWCDIAGFFPKDLIPNPKFLGEIPRHIRRYAEHWNWTHKSLRYGPNSFRQEPLNNTLTRQGCSAVRRGDKWFRFEDSGSWLGDVMYNGLLTDLTKGHIDRRKGEKGPESAVEANAFDDNNEMLMDGGRMIRTTPGSRMF